MGGGRAGGVDTQEQERRRIERNIHDGAQQDLAGLIAQIGVARAASDDNAEVAATLSRLQDDARRILAEVRELAQGIHPSVLRDGGLVAAIEDRCSRLPIDVNVTVEKSLSDRRLPSETEGAAYFFVAEAIVNALRHSASSSIDVSLQSGEGLLKIEVRDDGVGFDPTTASGGTGIVGLSDRIRALGGELSLTTGPGRGTVVAAELPIAVVPNRSS